MANSPTDVSESFVKSGMTLITQPASDRWLIAARKQMKQHDTDGIGMLKGMTK